METKKEQRIADFFAYYYLAFITKLCQGLYDIVTLRFFCVTGKHHYVKAKNLSHSIEWVCRV